ncbi:conjugal transfer protein [Streptomyces sp. cmx-18-6]|uniref:conjugal transfer protein n=1 Tax=Streptomyces sp. cmx-18-6 TaxID=2790930 RepID=UPI00397ED7F6
MTDHHSSADAAPGGVPSGQPPQPGPAQPGPTGPAHPGSTEQAAWQQGHAQQAQQTQGHGQQAPQTQQAHVPYQQQPNPGPYGYPAATAAPPHPQPHPQPSDAARAQVAAAWVRRAPQAAVPPSQAAVPPLPPRADDAPGASKKDKRERAKAERKAAYEQKKAGREERKQRGATAAPSRSSPASSASASAATARDRAGFDVPRPGGRLPSTGRRTHVALRATLLITTCAFALGSCGVLGLAVGASSGVQTAALDTEDVDRYRLTEFPTRAAATFAEEYAMLCMTYSPQTADTRRATLSRYVSAGVDADCGWSGQGTQAARLATWDGTVEELAEYGKHGRYMGVRVKLSTGRTTTLSVPVYVKDLAEGSGLRVAGDVGEMPLPVRGSAPEVDQDDEIVDRALSEQLRAKVLPGYFGAWGASDATAMTRFTTTDASQAATSGLAGALSAPEIRTVVALAPPGAETDDGISYKDGQPVQVRVTVVWGGGTQGGSAQSSGGQGSGAEAISKSQRSYRVTVVNTAQGWFIKDIRGGVLDPQGGRADEGDPVVPPVEPSGPPAADGADEPGQPTKPGKPEKSS